MALREKAEEIRRGEIERTLSKWENLTPQQRESLEALTGSIINKLLHSPLVVLKEEAHSSNGNLYIDAARRLFNLDGEPTRCRPKDLQEQEGEDAP